MALEAYQVTSGKSGKAPHQHCRQGSGGRSSIALTFFLNSTGQVPIGERVW